jgi:hypothetical protein
LRERNSFNPKSNKMVSTFGLCGSVGEFFRKLKILN